MFILEKNIYIVQVPGNSNVEKREQFRRVVEYFTVAIESRKTIFSRSHSSKRGSRNAEGMQRICRLRYSPVIKE